MTLLNVGYPRCDFGSLEHNICCILVYIGRLAMPWTSNFGRWNSSFSVCMKCTFLLSYFKTLILTEIIAC
jgi:hypothetical protein